VSKYLTFSLIENERQVITNGVIIFAEDNLKIYSVLNCSYHTEWAATYGSTLESRFRYTPTDCLETFPFPKNISKLHEHQLEQIGEAYHEHRRQLMLKMQLGLTKTYNAFHAKEITAGLANPSASADLTAFNMDKKAIEKKYGKEVWNLWNHLQKNSNTCTIEEAVAGIIHLRELHVEMDNAVLEAYGWHAPSVSPPAKGEYPQGEGVRRAGVGLLHDFYEVDYLPENDRIRFTIHPDARKEILKRLLELNHKIHDEEVKAGLWDKKKPAVKYETGKPNSNTAEEPEEGYGQGKLF